jgi:hypothetical protein
VVTPAVLFCGIAAAHPIDGPTSETPAPQLAAAVVEDSGRLLELVPVPDTVYGYARLTVVLAEHAAGSGTVAVATDSRDGTVGMLLAVADHRLVAVNDDESAEYVQRFAADLTAHAEVAGAEHAQALPHAADLTRAFTHAAGLARALQRGALIASRQPVPRDLAELRPLLTAHAAVTASRRAAALALRQVLRELDPTALGMFPDPTAPMALAFLSLLYDQSPSGDDLERQLMLRLAFLGLSDPATFTALRTELRRAATKDLAWAVRRRSAQVIWQTVMAVQDSNAAADSLMDSISAEVAKAHAGRSDPTPPSPADLAEQPDDSRSFSILGRRIQPAPGHRDIPDPGGIWVPLAPSVRSLLQDLQYIEQNQDTILEKEAQTNSGDVGDPEPKSHRAAHRAELPGLFPPVNDDNDLPIFSEVRSAWFTDHAGDQNEPPEWTTTNDDGWRTAQRAAEPRIEGDTRAGLPRRMPLQNLIPGSAVTPQGERPLRIVRDAATIAASTTRYFQGWRRGRETDGSRIGGRPDHESSGGWEFRREPHDAWVEKVAAGGWSRSEDEFRPYLAPNDDSHLAAQQSHEAALQAYGGAAPDPIPVPAPQSRHYRSPRAPVDPGPYLPPPATLTASPPARPVWQKASASPNAPDPGNLPVPNPTPRFLVGQMPTRVPYGADVSLIVRIAAQPPAFPDTTSAPLSGLMIDGDGARVTLVVQAQRGLLPVGGLEQVVWVPAAGDSQPARFTFQAHSVGLHRVQVTAWAGGTFLAEITLEVSVSVDAPYLDGSPRGAPIDTVRAEPGEVTLQVRFDGERYTFQLLSQPYFFEPVITESLTAQPTQAVERAITTLRAMAAGRAEYTGANARRWMKQTGVGLWTDMVPDVIKDQFWQVRSSVASFTIAAGRDVIPWELIYPLSATSDEGFLAEQFPVLRRVYGQQRSPEVATGAAHYIVPDSSPVNARDEIEVVRRVLRDNAEPAVVSDLAVLMDLIDAGNLGLLHFACHNTFKPDGGGSAIRMAGGPFVPALLNAAVTRRTLARTHPLVFINACRSAGVVPEYTQMSGWAQQFMAAGAGAFVGTLWAVHSDTAAVFARAFYEALVGGVRLGEAARQARLLASRDTDDATWLAYTVYGDPAARATVG